MKQQLALRIDNCHIYLTRKRKYCLGCLIWTRGEVEFQMDNPDDDAIDQTWLIGLLLEVVMVACEGIQDNRVHEFYGLLQSFSLCDPAQHNVKVQMRHS